MTLISSYVRTSDWFSHLDESVHIKQGHGIFFFIVQAIALKR